MLAHLLALTLAAAPKIAVVPVAAGEGVTEKTAGALTEALAAEVRRRSGAEVVTQREINTVLSLERQRAMMGCATDACMAELGGALGVDRLVNGDVARVGESLLVHFRLVEVAKVRVVAQADRRLRGGTLDDLLDALPAMVGELFEGTGVEKPAAARPKAPAQPETGAVAGPTPAAAKPLPPPWAEEPEKVSPEQLARLAVWQDGAGHYVATSPDDLDGGFYAGTAKKLFSVRTSGGGLDGGNHTGERSFWDPRAAERASFEWKPEGATLRCGGSVPMKRVPALEAKKLLARAEFLASRWRRIPHLLARDDGGVYFYVDGARKADGGYAATPEFRLYVGRKGALARVELDDAIQDSEGYVFVTGGGRLVARRQGQKMSLEWATGTTRIALTALEPADHGPLIYRELGVYPGQDLGTPCDGRF